MKDVAQYMNQTW